MPPNRPMKQPVKCSTSFSSRGIIFLTEIGDDSSPVVAFSNTIQIFFSSAFMFVTTTSSVELDASLDTISFHFSPDLFLC